MHTRFNHSMATYPSISPLSPPYIFSPLPHLIPRPSQYSKIIIIIITFSGQLPHRRSCVQASDLSVTTLTKPIKKINWKMTSQSRNVRKTRHRNVRKPPRWASFDYKRWTPMPFAHYVYPWSLPRCLVSLSSQNTFVVTP